MEYGYEVRVGDANALLHWYGLKLNNKRELVGVPVILVKKLTKKSIHTLDMALEHELHHLYNQLYENQP